MGDKKYDGVGSTTGSLRNIITRITIVLVWYYLVHPLKMTTLAAQVAEDYFTTYLIVYGVEENPVLE